VFFRKDNLILHKKRAHRPFTGVTNEGRAEDSEILETPSESELAALYQGTIDPGLLFTQTEPPVHVYSTRLGASGSRITFKFTKLARRVWEHRRIFQYKFYIFSTVSPEC
jgi:hypothetical protein